MRDRFRRALLVEREAKIAIAAVRNIFRSEQRRIEFRQQRIGAVGGRADAKQRKILQPAQSQAAVDPCGAVIEQQELFRFDISPPAGPWRKKAPTAREERRDLIGLAGERARGAGADEQTIAFRRSSWRRRHVSIRDRKLRQRIDQRQRFIVRDVLLRLRRVKERQRKMRRLRHRCTYWTVRVVVSGKPRPTVALI